MDKQTKQWVAATKAWVKTQEISIASCDMGINHAKQQIDLAKDAIRAETKEKILKINQLNDVKRNLAKYTK